MSGALFQYRADTILLADAMKAFAAATTKNVSASLGLVYAPQTCAFVKVAKDGVCEWPPKPEVAAHEIFEARLLNEHAALRWLRSPVSESGRGAAAVIARNELAPLSSIFDQLDTLFTVGEIEGQYLLWGTCASPDGGKPGWSRLTTARIGTLWVPLDAVSGGDSVVLTYIEHLGEGEHGNVFVAEERLTGLRPASAAKKQRGAP